MKYFAMIDGRQCGPFDLEQLPGAGLTPDTFVWCKGMPDWQRASEVADICRFYRQRLSGRHSAPEYPPSIPAPPPATGDIKERDTPQSYEPQSRLWNPRQLPPPDEDGGQGLFEETDFSRQPQSMLIPAIIATLMCLPLTGFVAIYYAIKTRKAWSASEHTDDAEQADTWRHEAHEASRSAKMWTGITFFLGLIVWAIFIR